MRTPKFVAVAALTVPALLCGSAAAAAARDSGEALELTEPLDGTFYESSIGLDVLVPHDVPASTAADFAEAEAEHLVQHLDPSEVALLDSGLPLEIDVDMATRTYTSVKIRDVSRPDVVPFFLSVGGACTDNANNQSCLFQPAPATSGTKIVGSTTETSPLWGGLAAYKFYSPRNVNASVCAGALGCAGVPKDTMATYGYPAIHVTRVVHN